MCLRDALAEIGTAEPRELLDAFRRRSTTVDTLTDETLSFDRHRRAQIEGDIDGVPYETDDPSWHFQTALLASAATDPDLLRAALDFAGLLEPGARLAERAGIMDKVLAAGAPEPPPGPSRAELLSILDVPTGEEPTCASA